MKSVAMYGTSSGKDKDKSTGRGEQVTENYLSGAVTNNGRKNYRKLHETPLNFCKKIEKENTNNNFKSQAKHLLCAAKRKLTEIIASLPRQNYTKVLLPPH